MIYRSNTTKLNEQTSLDESSNLVLLEYNGHYPDTYQEQEYDITDKDRLGMVKSKDIAVDKKSFDLIINTLVDVFKEKFEKYDLKAVFLEIFSYYWCYDRRGYMNDFELEFTYFKDTKRFGIDADVCDQNQTEYRKLYNKIMSVISKEYKKLPENKKYARAAIFLIRDGFDLKVDTFILPKHDDSELDRFLNLMYYDDSKNYNSKSNYGFGNKFMLAVDKTSEKNLVQNIEKKLKSKFTSKVKAIIIEIMVEKRNDGVYRFMAPFEIMDYEKGLNSGKLAFKSDPEYRIIESNILDYITDEYKKLPEDKRYNRARIIIYKKGNSIDADVMVRDPKIEFNYADVNQKVKDDILLSSYLKLDGNDKDKPIVGAYGF